MTRTNVIIDLDMVDAASKILGTSSRSETIRRAIEEVVRREQLKALAEASVDYKHIDPKILSRVDELSWR